MTFIFGFNDGIWSIEKSLMYADYSLKKFFETIADMDWFDNTLFILVADHTSISSHPFYGNILGQYLIPLGCFPFWRQFPDTAV